MPREFENMPIVRRWREKVGSKKFKLTRTRRLSASDVTREDSVPKQLIKIGCWLRPPLLPSLGSSSAAT